MIGIYKITSPSGKVYIGQSWNIAKRWYNYKSPKHNGQQLLDRSFNKYGARNHKFEVIHELPKDVGQDILNQYEILYIQLHKDSGFTVLNLSYGGEGGKHLSSTKKKISDTLKSKNIKPPSRTGMLLTDDHKAILLNSRKGKKNSDAHNEILKQNGNKVSKDHLAKMLTIRWGKVKKTNI